MISGKTNEGEQTAVLRAAPKWLAVPANFAGSTATAHTAELSWQAVPDARGYYLYRCNEVNGKYKRIAALSSSILTYVDKNLPNTTYYYKLLAYSQTGSTKIDGYLSAALNVDVSALDAPGGVSIASSTKYNTAVINWDAVSGASGFYVMYHDTAKDKYVRVATVRASKNATYTFTIKGVPPGTPEYAVAAYKTVSGKSYMGDLSGNVAVTPNVLEAPAGITTSNAGFHAIKLEWQRVTDASGYYVLQSPTENGQYTQVADITSGKKLTCTIKGLSAEKHYFKVVAYVKIGKTGYAGKDPFPVSAEPELLPAITGLDGEATSPFAVKLTWDRVPGSSGYQIYRSASKNGSYRLIGSTTSWKTTTYTDKNIDATGFYYKVVAYVSASKNAFSGKLPATSVKLTANRLASPTDLSVAAVDLYSVKLTWKTVSGAKGYEIFSSTTENGTYASIGSVTSGSTSTFTAKGLTEPGKHYFYVVPFITAGIQRLYGGSSPVANTTPTAISAPATVTAESAIRAVKVSWSKVSNVSGYYIYLKKDGDPAPKKVAKITSGNTTSYIEHGLPNTGYFIYVSSYKRFGLTEVESERSAKYGAANSKEVPVVNLTKAFPLGYSDIKLEWKAQAGVSGYIVERKAASGVYVEYATVPGGGTTSFTDTKPAAQKENAYKVRAYISYAGSIYKGEAGNEKTATPRTLLAVRFKSVDSISKTSLQLKWETNDSCDGYAIYRQKEGGSYTKITTIDTFSTGSYTDKSLETDAFYSYKIVSFRTVDGKLHNAPDSKVISARPVTELMRNVRIEGISGKQVTLAWNESMDATGYRIYRRKKNASRYDRIHEIPKTSTTSYTDKGITAAGEYEYYVVPYRLVGTDKLEGTPSGTLIATVS